MLDPEVPKGFRLNEGQCPNAVRGKRVVVLLRSGRICGEEAVSAATPPGWAADGKGGARWTLQGSPFDIFAWKLLGDT